jgi:hypothetical protein
MYSNFLYIKNEGISLIEIIAKLPLPHCHVYLTAPQATQNGGALVTHQLTGMLARISRVSIIGQNHHSECIAEQVQEVQNMAKADFLNSLSLPLTTLAS